MSAQEKNNISLTYQGSFDIQTLSEKNSRFRGFDSIQEVEKEISPIFLEKDKVFITQENNTLHLSFDFLGKKTEIDLNKNNNLDNLFSLYGQINLIINKYKKCIFQICSKVDSLKKNMNELKKKNNAYRIEAILKDEEIDSLQKKIVDFNINKTKTDSIYFSLNQLVPFITTEFQKVTKEVKEINSSINPLKKEQENIKEEIEKEHKLQNNILFPFRPIHSKNISDTSNITCACFLPSEKLVTYSASNREIKIFSFPSGFVERKITIEQNELSIDSLCKIDCDKFVSLAYKGHHKTLIKIWGLENSFVPLIIKNENANEKDSRNRSYSGKLFWLTDNRFSVFYLSYYIERFTREVQLGGRTARVPSSRRIPENQISFTEVWELNNEKNNCKLITTIKTENGLNFMLELKSRSFIVMTYESNNTYKVEFLNSQSFASEHIIDNVDAYFFKELENSNLIGANGKNLVIINTENFQIEKKISSEFDLNIGIDNVIYMKNGNMIFSGNDGFIYVFDTQSQKYIIQRKLCNSNFSYLFLESNSRLIAITYEGIIIFYTDYDKILE